MSGRRTQRILAQTDSSKNLSEPPADGDQKGVRLQGEKLQNKGLSDSPKITVGQVEWEETGREDPEEGQARESGTVGIQGTF